MKETAKIKKLYSEIQTRIYYMIPEKWDKVYLYASVIENINSIETGEMFFYYLPKGILKKNFINAYEVPAKFNIEEDQYMVLAEKLYDTIKELRNEQIINNERAWSNITISIENSKFNIEYRYDNLLNSKYSENDRRIIWKYIYLNEPIEKLTRKEQRMINDYLFEQNLINSDTYKHQENIYIREMHNVIDYDKDIPEEIDYDNIQLQKVQKEIDKQNKKEQKIKKKGKVEEEQFEIKGKNQILNF